MKDLEELDDKMLDGVTGGSANTETDENFRAWSDLLDGILFRIVEDKQNGTGSSLALRNLQTWCLTCRDYHYHGMNLNGPVKKLKDALEEAAKDDPVFGDYIIRIKELL